MSVIAVLVVEDNPGDAALIRFTLNEPEAGNFKITHSTTLADAVQRLGQASFDVILLDLSLPDSRGLDTVLSIRRAAPETAVVVLSGLDDEDLALEAVKCGAQDYLVKGKGEGESLRRAIRYAIERQKIEADMRLAEAVFNNSDTGIAVTDPSGLIVRANPAFTRITGYDSDEVQGCSMGILRSGIHDEDFYKGMWQALKESGHWEGEIWNRRKTGEIFPEWLRIDAVKDRAGGVRNYVAIFTDITFRKAIEDQLRLQATHDTLTGLPNRYLFTDRLLQSIALSERSGQRTALLFIDLDGFKNVNDRFGHAAGDQLLNIVADRLRELVRASDTVARLAGDEFTIVLSGLNKKSDAATVAEKIVEALSEPYKLEAGDANISASVGIAFYPDDAADHDKLIIAADAAMYAIKQHNKNGYGFFSQTSA